MTNRQILKIDNKIVKMGNSVLYYEPPFQFPTDGLTVNYKFNSTYYTEETSGFTDLSTSDVDGISRNDPNFSNDSMIFDGVDDDTGDVVSFNSAVLVDNTTWSVCFWIKNTYHK